MSFRQPCAPSFRCCNLKRLLAISHCLFWLQFLFGADGDDDENDNDGDDDNQDGGNQEKKKKKVCGEEAALCESFRVSSFCLSHILACWRLGKCVCF